MGDELHRVTRLSKKSEMLLLALGDEVKDCIAELGGDAWADLCDIMVQNLKTIDFELIFSEFSPSDYYYRIPINCYSEELFVVLFVFKPSDSDQGAILLHIYEQEMPNDRVYEWEEVSKEVPKKGAKIMRTLPHSHNSKCYSSVAWVGEGVEVTEERYAPHQEADKIELVGQTSREVYSCEYDSAENEVIHSISVHFL